MPKGELENRDRDELGVPNLPGMGELSEELASERGELDSYSTRDVGNGVPADMQVAADEMSQAMQVGIGSPKIDYGVRSIYDSRPINHREFNLWFRAAQGEGYDPANFDWARQCFQVPRGFVAVLRKVTILVVPNPTPLNYDGFYDILVDGAVRDPQDVVVGPTVDFQTPEQMSILFRDGDPVETFIIADELNFIGLALTIDNINVLTSADVQIGFHGQFLSKTGVPAQFQAANEAGSAKVADVALPADLNIPSGADFLVKRRRQKDPFAFIPLLHTPK